MREGGRKGSDVLLHRLWFIPVQVVDPVGSGYIRLDLPPHPYHLPPTCTCWFPNTSARTAPSMWTMLLRIQYVLRERSVNSTVGEGFEGMEVWTQYVLRGRSVNGTVGEG